MIRLARTGAKKKPQYRVVVIEKERANSARFVEIVGHYNPRKSPPELELVWERIEHWMARGAQPSETVRGFLRRRKAEPQESSTSAA